MQQQLNRVLLIDDDFDHLLVCSLILQKNGYQVMSLPGCEKMEELIETVETFKPHLIFMDHDMRGICGMDLSRALKSHDIHNKIPIIYFSARAEIIELAKEAQADGYLAKPFEIDGLVEVTRKYMSQA